MTEYFEPLIVGFFCNWNKTKLVDLASISRLVYPPNVRPMRRIRSGELDPEFVVNALSGGADGVLVTGWHPGESEHLEQNSRSMRRYLLFRRSLNRFGVEPERLKLVWASAGEGARFVEEASKFVEEVRALGPLYWPAVLSRRSTDDAIVNQASRHHADGGSIESLRRQTD